MGVREEASCPVLSASVPIPPSPVSSPPVLSSTLSLDTNYPHA